MVCQLEGSLIYDALILPPGFRASAAIGDPFPWALGLVAACEPGTAFWNGDGGRCRVALALAPDRAISAGTLTEMGLLALYDALAVLAPSQVPIKVDGAALRVDGARAAWVQAELGPGSVPEWAILGIEVVLVAGGENPGETPDETSLSEEGFGAVTPGALLELFCRYLLAWIETWRDEGAAGLARAVTERRVGRMVQA